MVYIMLAKGFEEIEALTVCDVLRRAGIACALVSQEKAVTGAHGITVNADILIGEVDLTALDAIVLPGGMPGVDNLENDAKVQDILKFAVDNDLLVCAICAAPPPCMPARLLPNTKISFGFNEVIYSGVTRNAIVMFVISFLNSPAKVRLFCEICKSTGIKDE